EQLTAVTIEKVVSDTTSQLGNFTYDDPDDDAQYRLSASGRRNALHESMPSQSRILHYNYDSHNRLLSELINPGVNQQSISYDKVGGTEATTGYDAVGNRRSRNSSVPQVPTVTDQRYDPDDRLT